MTEAEKNQDDIQIYKTSFHIVCDLYCFNSCQ